MKPLFAHEFQHIFYNLSLVNRPDRVSEGLRSLAYKLEAGVMPTRGQREPIVGAMKQLPELVMLWSDYTVRLPCWQHEGVKHAGYRALAKDADSRKSNAEFLRDARRSEDGKGRLNIALALTTRPGTYDSVLRGAPIEDVYDTITWHSYEVDDATSGRLFDFLVHNSKNNQDAIDYIAHEVETGGHSQNDNLRTLNRRSRELPPALTWIGMKSRDG